MSNIDGIAFKTIYNGFTDTSKIEILGKSMLDWVKLALSTDFLKDASYKIGTDNIDELIRQNLGDKEYTVVLFSDTPLISRKTIIDAVNDLIDLNENGIALTRGYVFKTEYIKNNSTKSFKHRFYDEEDFLTAFNYKQTAMVAEVLKNRIISYHMSQGVQFDDPTTTYVGCDVVIEKGSVVGELNTIKGNSVVRSGARLDKGNTIIDSVLDEGCTVFQSVIKSSFIGAKAQIGPFSHIRDYSKIGAECRIGNFVEVKGSIIGKRTKASHHAYIGDAQIGENCNIGCGTVFCNYDGKNKHKTIIGNNCFIGSNSNLIAPIRIGEGSFIAAGSTIDEDTPKHSFSIARSRQTTKPNYKHNKENKDKTEIKPKAENVEIKQKTENTENKEKLKGEQNE